MPLTGGQTNPNSAAARTIALSSARASASGAYRVERLNPEGFVVCIRKENRVVALAGVDATQGELLGMAAAPALARALVGILKAVTPEERITADAKARAALFAAGVENIP